MMSTWIRSAPARSASSTWSDRRTASEPRLFPHPVVACGMFGRHAALVSEQHRDPSPPDVEARQDFVAPPGSRAAGKDKGARPCLKRARDLIGGGLGDLFGRGQTREFPQLHLPHEFEAGEERAVEDGVVRSGREQV